METTYRPLYCLNNYRNIHQTYSMLNTEFYGLFSVSFLNFFSHKICIIHIPYAFTIGPTEIDVLYSIRFIDIIPVYAN